MIKKKKTIPDDWGCFQVGRIGDGRENARRSEISLFPDRPRLSRLIKTENRRHPRSSGMVANKSGKSGVFLFSRRVPDFCEGRRSFSTSENSSLYCR